MNFLHVDDKTIVCLEQDTPVKIDSSSEGEDATNDIESALNSRDQQFPSDLQFAVERYLRFLHKDALLSYIPFNSVIFCLSAFKSCRLGVSNASDLTRFIRIVQIIL